MASSRHHPNVTVRKNVSNQSSRNGAKPTLIVLHDTEGGNVPKSSRDLQGLADFFDLPATDASSHVGVDQDGNSSRMVPDSRKAWTQAFYNSVSLSIEQIGFARENWRGAAKKRQVEESARWVAWWSKQHGIPIRRAIVAPNGKVVRSGVIQHRNLGSLGGGHSDVNANYPMRRLLSLAKAHRKAM